MRKASERDYLGKEVDLDCVPKPVMCAYGHRKKCVERNLTASADLK
jgi:hypothetical protein